jgi:hypothetical protein
VSSSSAYTSTFNLLHSFHFPTSPLPPLPPQPPRTVVSPSVMHTPPSAWPQHHTLLEAPAVNVTLSDLHTSQPLTLSLSDARTHKTTEWTTMTCTHARTHADNVSSLTCTTAASSGRLRFFPFPYTSRPPAPSPTTSRCFQEPQKCPPYRSRSSPTRRHAHTCTQR